MGEVLEFRQPTIKRPLIVGMQHMFAVEPVPIEFEKPETKFERPKFHVIHNPEINGGIQEVLQTRGAKFWRLDTGFDLIPYPDTDQFRLNQLTAAYRVLENLSADEERLRERWTKRPSIKTIEDRMAQYINLGKGRGNYPAIELFDDAAVNHFLMQELDFINDPRFAVIRAFEKWRVQTAVESSNHPRVSEEDLNRGYRAFELFLFGAGGGYFKKMLQEQAKVHFIPES